MLHVMNFVSESVSERLVSSSLCALANIDTKQSPSIMRLPAPWCEWSHRVFNPNMTSVTQSMGRLSRADTVCAVVQE